jgi:transposase
VSTASERLKNRAPVRLLSVTLLCELLAARLQCLQQAGALTPEEARVSGAVLQRRSLLDQLRAFRKPLAILEAEIQTGFAVPPEAARFRDRPGVGPALAPRLCVAFGTLRPLYPDPASLQKHAGVAPVREKSGPSLWTHWRWLAPAFLRQSFVEWAGQTGRHAAWAKVYYERMQAKGKGHHALLRALAFQGIRVLWKCWQTRTPYDEARYLQQLVHRKSPNAVPV